MLTVVIVDVILPSVVAPKLFLDLKNNRKNILAHNRISAMKKKMFLTLEKGCSENADRSWVSSSKIYYNFYDCLFYFL
jgi:hypothetical protein